MKFPAHIQHLPAMLRLELSWTHYRRLQGVEDLEAREWYMREAAGQPYQGSKRIRSGQRNG